MIHEVLSIAILQPDMDKDRFNHEEFDQKILRDEPYAFEDCLNLVRNIDSLTQRVNIYGKRYGWYLNLPFSQELIICKKFLSHIEQSLYEVGYLDPNQAGILKEHKDWVLSLIRNLDFNLQRKLTKFYDDRINNLQLEEPHFDEVVDSEDRYVELLSEIPKKLEEAHASRKIAQSDWEAAVQSINGILGELKILEVANNNECGEALIKKLDAYLKQKKSPKFKFIGAYGLGKPLCLMNETHYSADEIKKNLQEIVDDKKLGGIVRAKAYRMIHFCSSEEAIRALRLGLDNFESVTKTSNKTSIYPEILKRLGLLW